MRLHPVWGLILFFFAALATTSLAYGADLPGGTPSGYERREIEGFTVYVNQDVFKHPYDRWGRAPLSVLERELNDLRRILVPKIVSVLQEVPIWAEWDVHDQINPGAIARYYGGSADGLVKLGGDGRKANCVEILTLRRLGEIRHPGTPLQQVIILHEMAHAVHHRLLGWQNPELKATFQQAVDRKLYDEVNDRFGRRAKAYARTNELEYFAEISCLPRLVQLFPLQLRSTARLRPGRLRVRGTSVEASGTVCHNRSQTDDRRGSRQRSRSSRSE